MHYVKAALTTILLLYACSIEELWDEVNNDYSISIKKAVVEFVLKDERKEQAAELAQKDKYVQPLAPFIIVHGMAEVRCCVLEVGCRRRDGRDRREPEIMRSHSQGKHSKPPFRCILLRRHTTMHSYAADLSAVPKPWTDSFHEARASMHTLLHLGTPMLRFALSLWNEAFVETQVRIVDTRNIMAQKEAHTLRDFVELVDKDIATCRGNLKSNWIEVMINMMQQQTYLRSLSNAQYEGLCACMEARTADRTHPFYSTNMWRKFPGCT